MIDRPHAASRAAQEHARLLREAVDADPERGLMLLSADCKVLYCNAAARRHLHDDTPRGQDRLLPLVVDQAARELLARAQRERAAQACEIPYPSEEARRVRLVLEATERDLGWYIVLRLSVVRPWSEPTIRRLQTRFDLTVREAQVAVAVARGQSNGEAATSLGIVEKTVKNALMIVYQKCGVRNRVELALAVYDAPLPGKGAPI
jgi:DNA-binding CsgD family transcriptional regulator